MAGFPTRPTRASFGPTYENERAVRDPAKDIGAPIFNLDFWQLAGVGRVVPRATIVFSVDGVPAVSAVPFQGLAWDPNGALSALAITRTGLGVYNIPFAANYPDEVGANQALVLIAGSAQVQGVGVVRHCQVDIPSPNVADVHIFDLAGAPADPTNSDVLVQLW